MIESATPLNSSKDKVFPAIGEVITLISASLNTVLPVTSIFFRAINSEFVGVGGGVGLGIIGVWLSCGMGVGIGAGCKKRSRFGSFDGANPGAC